MDRYNSLNPTVEILFSNNFHKCCIQEDLIRARSQQAGDINSATFPVQIFEDFLRLCLSKEPQIHRLYDNMCGIIRTVCLRFLKKDEVQGRHKKDLIHVDVTQFHQLSDDGLTSGKT